LYAAGYLNTEINEVDTNKIEWKKAKKLWKTDILTRLESYNPFGPRSKPTSEYFMVNRLLDQINAFLPNLEGLRDYSSVISRLFDFINISKILTNDLVYNVRKDDVNNRKQIKQELMDNREKKIKEKELLEEKREAERNKIIEVMITNFE